MSNPTDQASHKLLDPDPVKSEIDSVADRGRSVGNTLLSLAAVLGGIEATAYYFHVLQIWQSYLVTPLVPILVTLALFIDYEVKLMQEPWKRRRLQDDFAKSSLILLGTIVATFGLVVFLVGISTVLTRVTMDVGAGSTLTCAGVYVVKRFSW